MKATLLDNPPISGSIHEEYFEATGFCSFVRFSPEDAEDWVGVFGKGEGQLHSAVIPYSDGRNVFVIAGGQGYIVDGYTKLVLHKSRCGSRANGISVPGRDFVIIHNYTDLFAFSKEGCRWTSDRIALDDIELQSSSDQSLHGRLWDIHWRRFTLFYDGWKLLQENE